MRQLFLAFTLIMCALLIPQGCTNNTGCKPIDISKEEKEWLKPALKYDTIFFETELGQKNSFAMETESLLDYTSCSKFALGPYIYQIGGYTYSNLDKYPVKKYRDRFSISFNKTGQDKSDKLAEKCIDFFDISTGYFFDMNNFDVTDTLIPVLNKTVPVYVFSKNWNCSTEEGYSDVMSGFAISKEYGLMWYTLSNGDVYSRIWK